jgi:hypothetical protein
MYRMPLLEYGFRVEGLGLAVIVKRMPALGFRV